MKESKFIKQNKAKWAELESTYENSEKDPEKTSRLFVKVTDDLSFAKTFYQNRSVRQYLNGIAQLLFIDLHKARRVNGAFIWHFFSHKVPMAMYYGRKSLLLALILFLFCMALGMVTSMQDQSFAEDILGKSYIDETENNIAKGAPMDIYNSSSEFGMFVRIAANNLIVSFRVFAAGILLAFGTLFIIIYNGVMVGVFQYFFIEKGLFWESFLSIWTHGTLEIACIIMSGGAGLLMGSGLLFPGTYRRIDAFKVSARSGLTIMLGISPILVLAAFIEGFQTRHTEIPDVYRLLFILACLVFVLFYFWWYPKKLAKRNPNYHKAFEIEPKHPPIDVPAKDQVYNLNELMGHGFALFFKKGASNLTWLTVLAGITALVVTLNPGEFFPNFVFYPNQNVSLKAFLSFEQLPVHGAFLAVISMLALMINNRNNLQLFNGKKEKFRYKHILSSLAIMLLVLGLLGFQSYAAIFTAIGIFPALILSFNIGVMQNTHLLKGIGQFRWYLHGNQRKFYTLYLVIFLLAAAIYGLSALLLSGLVQTSIVTLLTDNPVVEMKLVFFMSIFGLSFSLLSVIMLVNAFCAVAYYSFRESLTAENLLTRIQNMKIHP